MITILTKIKTKTIKENFCYLNFFFLNEIFFLSNIKSIYFTVAKATFLILIYFNSLF